MLISVYINSDTRIATIDLVGRVHCGYVEVTEVQGVTIYYLCN